MEAIAILITLFSMLMRVRRWSCKMHACRRQEELLTWGFCTIAQVCSCPSCLSHASSSDPPCAQLAPPGVGSRRVHVGRTTTPCTEAETEWHLPEYHHMQSALQSAMLPALMTNDQRDALTC